MERKRTLTCLALLTQLAAATAAAMVVAAQAWVAPGDCSSCPIHSLHTCRHRAVPPGMGGVIPTHSPPKYATRHGAVPAWLLQLGNKAAPAMIKTLL